MTIIMKQPLLTLGKGLLVAKVLICSRLGQTMPSVFEHGFDLFASHAGKPCEKIIHTSAIFEVLEECFYGNARARGSSQPPRSLFQHPASRGTRYAVWSD